MAWIFLLRKRASLTPSEAASKRRFYVFALCLLFSATFWLFTKLAQETSASFTRPLVFTTFPEGLLAASQSDSTVTFELETTGGRLINYYISSRDDTLTIDAGALNVLRRDGKEHHFVTGTELRRLLIDKVSAWGSINVIKPDTVFLELVPATEKRLPVKLHAELFFEQRFRQYGSITIKPDTVLVAGPISILDTLEFVTTSFWSPEKLRQTTQEKLQLKIPAGSASIHLEKKYVEVTVPVAEFTQADIELNVGIVCPEDYDTAKIRLFPGKVNVSILIALQDYARIGAHMFDASVNCPQMLENSDGRLEIIMDTYPSFVEILRISPPFVEYIIHE